jgi:DNA-binding IclR family transcriptional regulator
VSPTASASSSGGIDLTSDASPVLESSVDRPGSAGERRSPPTARVVAVLGLFAAHPRQAFGLSEVARRLDVGKATCLAILNELVAAGYLVRDEATREHALGPAALGLGFAAQEGLTAIRAARPRLDRLADDLGMAGTASAVTGDAHVVLARSGPATEGDPTSRVGQRFPFSPPWGTANVAWAPDDDVDAWLARPPIVPVDVDRGRLRQVIRAARRLGALVELATDVGTRVNATLARYAEAPAPAVDLITKVASTLGYREYLLDPIDDGARYDVAMLAAPTFDRAGRQELLVALFGPRHQLPGAELRAHLAALVTTTGAITADVGGHDPWTTA